MSDAALTSERTEARRQGYLAGLADARVDVRRAADLRLDILKLASDKAAPGDDAAAIVARATTYAGFVLPGLGG